MKSHSPVVVALLLAATLALDAVALTWLARGSVLSLAAVLYDALISAQLAVVLLWATFSARRLATAWGAVLLGVVAASLPAWWLDLLEPSDALGIYGGYAVLLGIALWTLKRTRYWQTLTAAAPTTWQFSVIHLLAAFTLAAVMIELLRHSIFITAGGGFWRFLAALTLSDVLLALVTLVPWAWNRPLLVRLAAALGLALAIGSIEAIGAAHDWLGLHDPQAAQQPALDYLGYSVIMAAVVFAWLELAPIVPHPRRAAALPPTAVTE